MLVRLLYASRAAKPLNAKTIATILLECQRNNPRRGITGVLCYSDEIFLQVLEGGRDAVCDTFNSIVRDGRHETVRLLSFDEISERRFGGWSMGQVNIEKINSSLLLKYAEKAELNPFSVSGKVSMALLEELIATASVLGRSA
jgi:Sensors of blue-light using FAD